MNSYQTTQRNILQDSHLIAVTTSHVDIYSFFSPSPNVMNFRQGEYYERRLVNLPPLITSFLYVSLMFPPLSHNLSLFLFISQFKLPSYLLIFCPRLLSYVLPFFFACQKYLSLPNCLATCIYSVRNPSFQCG